MQDKLYIIDTNNQSLVKALSSIQSHNSSWQRFIESVCTEITLGTFGQAKQIYTIPWEELDLLLKIIDKDNITINPSPLNYIYFDYFLDKQPIYIKFDRNPISRDRLRKED